MVNDSTVVVFDEKRAVANAGVLLSALLAGRLGIEALVDQTVRCLKRHLVRTIFNTMTPTLGDTPTPALALT